MHEVDQTTEQMVRSVLAYAENRLRMNPVPFDMGTLSADELYERLDGLIRDRAATARRGARRLLLGDRAQHHLGGQPAVPRLHPGGADQGQPAVRHARVLRLDPGHLLAGGVGRDRRGEHGAARDRRRGRPARHGRRLLRVRWLGGQPVVARRRPRDRQEGSGRARQRGRRLRVVVGIDAHSSIVNTLRLLEMDALVVETPDHRLTARRRCGPRSTTTPTSPTSPPWSAPRAPPTPASSTTSPGSARWRKERGWWFHVDGAYGGSGIFAKLAEAEVRRPRAGRLVHPRPAQVAVHAVRLLRGDLPRPRAGARRTHTQDASYLDVIHVSDGEWNPTDYAYHLTRRARGLPLWFSLAVYGVDAYRDAIEVAVSLARRDRRPDQGRPAARADPRARPRRGAVPPARLEARGLRRWAQRLHEDEVAFIPPSKWDGETVGRFAFLHPDTSMDLVREVLARTE